MAKNTFQDEINRAANIICAAITSCFEIGLDSNSFPPELAFSPIKFVAYADPKFGKLVENHIKGRIIFVNVPPLAGKNAQGQPTQVVSPLQSWMPTSMAFIVPHDQIPAWKKTILEERELLIQDLMAALKEERDADRAEEAADIDPETVGTGLPTEDLGGDDDLIIDDSPPASDEVVA